MVKKIDIEIDVTASGFGRDGKVFSHDNISKEIKEVKGILRRDGSGRGIRLNKGRSGCEITEKFGRGKREWD